MFITILSFFSYNKLVVCLLYFFSLGYNLTEWVEPIYKFKLLDYIMKYNLWFHLYKNFLFYIKNYFSPSKIIIPTNSLHCYVPKRKYRTFRDFLHNVTLIEFIQHIFLDIKRTNYFYWWHFDELLYFFVLFKILIKRYWIPRHAFFNLVANFSYYIIFYIFFQFITEFLCKIIFLLLKKKRKRLLFFQYLYWIFLILYCKINLSALYCSFTSQYLTDFPLISGSVIKLIGPASIVLKSNKIS